MPSPVVHFEIIGRDPTALRKFYADLFGWEFDTSGRVSPTISNETDYGFVPPPDGAGPVAGGVGGGASFEPQTVFYVHVPDVHAALRRVEELGGTRVLGPEQSPGGPLVIGQFRDPEGNLIGLAAKI